MEDGRKNGAARQRMNDCCMRSHVDVASSGSDLVAATITSNRMTPNRSRMVPLWLLMLLLVGSSIRITNATCSICLNSNDTPSGMLGSQQSCQDYASTVSSLDESSDLCAAVRLQGYLYCNCSTYPTDAYCFMCADETFARSVAGTDGAEELIPFFNQSCQNSLYADISGMMSNTTQAICQDIARFDYYCGCPTAQRSDCFFCTGNGDNATLDDSVNITTRRRVPPSFQYTCADYQKGSSLFSTMDGSCEAWLGPVLDIMPNVQAYCGCPNATNSSGVDFCNLCSGDPLVDNADTAIPPFAPYRDYQMTCTDVDVMTSYILADQKYCTQLQHTVAAYCCQGISRLPSQSPAPSTVGGRPTMFVSLQPTTTYSPTQNYLALPPQSQSNATSHAMAHPASVLVSNFSLRMILIALWLLGMLGNPLV